MDDHNIRVVQLACTNGNYCGVLERAPNQGLGEVVLAPCFRVDADGATAVVLPRALIRYGAIEWPDEKMLRTARRTLNIETASEGTSETRDIAVERTVGDRGSASDPPSIAELLKAVEDMHNLTAPIPEERGSAVLRSCTDNKYADVAMVSGSRRIVSYGLSRDDDREACIRALAEVCGSAIARVSFSDPLAISEAVIEATNLLLRCVTVVRKDGA